MKFSLALFMLFALATAGCGSSSDPTHKKDPGPTTGPQTSDGPTIVAKEPKNQPKPPRVRPKKPVITYQPIPDVPNLNMVPLARPFDFPVYMPPAPPPPAPYIVSMGSSEVPDKEFLTKWGPERAIINATFCATTSEHSFLDSHARCYVVYNDGRTVYVTSDQFKDIQIYITELRMHLAEAKKAKKEKKNKK